MSDIGVRDKLSGLGFIIIKLIKEIVFRLMFYSYMTLNMLIKIMAMVIYRIIVDYSL